MRPRRSAADARRHRVADCEARHHGQGRRVEHHRSGARRQHRARLPERRRRHPRRRGRRRRSARSGRSGSMPAAPARCGSARSRYKDLHSRVVPTEHLSEQVPAPGPDQLLLLLGTGDRRLQQGRLARHRLRPVLLPRAQLHRGAADLHPRHDRPGHAVFQRAAVRLRLHRRRLAGRAERRVHAGRGAVREPEGRRRDAGRPTRSPT